MLLKLEYNIDFYPLSFFTADIQAIVLNSFIHTQAYLTFIIRIVHKNMYSYIVATCVF